MLESILLGFSIILIIVYGAILYAAIRGMENTAVSLSDDLNNFSIIIAARNEEKNIKNLCESLSGIDYPKERFEIIIVNDRSNDSTAPLLEQYSRQLNNVKILSLTENNSDMPHKKNALRTAIASSQFEILAFTDADCIIPKNWLNELSKYFSESVGVVAGNSPYRTTKNRIFNSFLRYEEYKNSLLAISAIGLKKAYLCTGRNFAYRKKVYDDVGGFEAIKQSVSGDDDLFIQLVRRTTPWEIRYMTSPDSFVHTDPPESFSQFINQRIRHISASKYYSPDVAIVLGSFHLLLLVSILLLFLNPFWGLVLFAIRVNFDAIFMAYGKNILAANIGTIDFFLNEILLSLYTVTIGPLGYLKKFNWKEA